eukprot:Partr_v1_DN27678_c0_g1_i1_m65347 putative HECTc
MDSDDFPRSPSDGDELDLRTPTDVRSPTHASMSDIRYSTGVQRQSSSFGHPPPAASSSSVIPAASPVTLPTTQESLMNRYIRQLLYGCHSAVCTNPFCASNPVFELGSTQEISTLASTLARTGPAHLCQTVISTSTPVSPVLTDNTLSPPSPRVSSSSTAHTSAAPASTVWTVDNIFSLVKESNETNQTARLMRVLYDVFSSAGRLLAFFGLTTIAADPSNCPIDKDMVKQVSHQITVRCQPVIINSIMSAITCLLDTLKLQSSVSQAECVAICVVLCCPALLDSSYHATVLIRLYDYLAGVTGSQERLDLFQSQVVRFFRLSAGGNDETALSGRRDLQMLVGTVQHFITMRIYTLTSQFGYSLAPNKDDPIINATRTLSIFYGINESLKSISYEEFYNDAVNEHLEIKDDFPHWKAKEGFSFCNFPFILNPATKSDILKVESMVQMRHELQDAFFRAMFIGVNSPYLVLEIRRDYIIRDALYQLEHKKAEDLKKQLKIQFVGEEAVDEGGVQKEFFQLAIREIFQPQYNLFTTHNNFHWFTLHPVDQASLEEMKLVGMLIGLAIYNGVILDVNFPVVLYKKLIGNPVDLDDLLHLEPVLGRSLKMLLEYTGDVESDFARTFRVDLDVLGQQIPYDLIDNGEHVALTSDNRQQFVNLYVDLVLNRSVKDLFSAFKTGFDQVCRNSAISLFRAEELELLVGGSSTDMDFEELKNVTTYDGGYTDKSDVIVFFWEAVMKYDLEQKKRLLFFATGTDRVPIGGLSKMTFCIVKNGPSSNRLPSSHTCFNVLLLPEYDDRAHLEERLLTALQNAEGFGMI